MGVKARLLTYAVIGAELLNAAQHAAKAEIKSNYDDLRLVIIDENGNSLCDENGNIIIAEKRHIDTAVNAEFVEV